MLWHEWLRVILLFGLIMSCGAYWFIGVMEELFPSPKIFDKLIDTIYKHFKKKGR